MDKEIVIKPSFVFKDYLNINIFLFLRSPQIFVFIIIDVLFISYFTYYYSLGSIALFELQLIYFASLVLYPIFIYFLKYIQTKRSLEDPRLKEDITFRINQTNLIDFGQSYSRNYTFSEMLKIMETKHFFLFYITKHMVKIIRKADLKENQYNELKELFNSLNIKKSLK
jgi:hypothetical protein